MPEQMTKLDLLTIQEAAERYRVSTSTIRRLIESGEIPSTRIGRRGAFRISARQADAALGVK